MPVLNARFHADEVAPDGKRVSVSSAAALHESGPLVQVVLTPLESRIRALVDDGKEVIPVTGNALIDTGAHSTCIDQKAAEGAGLIVVDTGRITSATHTAHEVPIFAGRLSFTALPNSVDAHRAYGANLEEQGLIALIGRDVLKFCVLIYNGADGSFSLSM